MTQGCTRFEWLEFVFVSQKYITSDVPEMKSFVESGGNSVMAVAMTEDIHHLFGVDSAPLLDIVLHGTLQGVINYVILAFPITDRFTKLNDEHDSGNAIVPVDNISTTNFTPDTPSVLPSYPMNDLANLKPKHRKHGTLSALPPRKRIKRNDVKYSPLEGVLECSTGNELLEIDDAAVLSIQRGSRTVCYQDLSRPNMSSVPRVHDVVVPTLEMEVCWKFDTGKCVDASPLIVSLRYVTLYACAFVCHVCICMSCDCCHVCVHCTCVCVCVCCVFILCVCMRTLVRACVECNLTFS